MTPIPTPTARLEELVALKKRFHELRSFTVTESLREIKKAGHLTPALAAELLAAREALVEMIAAVAPMLTDAGAHQPIIRKARGLLPTPEKQEVTE
jgi:hypothetical protein